MLLEKSREEVPMLLKDGKITICVVGGGYVGLPSGVLLADLGANVIVCNRTKEKNDALNAGKAYIKEAHMDEMLERVVKNGRLCATSDVEGSVAKSDVILITVGTPLNKDGVLDDAQVRGACVSVGKGLKKGSLVILRSTVNPGTTERVVLPILEKNSGMRLGEFGLCDVPERLQEGKAIENLKTDSIVIGGFKFQRKSCEIAAGLFDILKVPIEIVSTPTASELSKLVWNYLLDSSVANAQIIAQICEKIGADVMEIRKNANLDPRIRMMIPGPGTGGPCMPKDVTALYNTAKNLGIEKNCLESLRLVRVINGVSMPQHAISLVKECLDEKGIDLKNAEIGVLGLTFKGGTDDLRESPALKAVNEIKNVAKKVDIFDPYIKDGVVEGANMKRTWQSALENKDLCLVLTDHKEFFGIRLDEMKKIMKGGCLVDTRHVFNADEARKYFTYRGIGHGV